MKTIKIWNDAPSERQVKEIAAILADGQTAILPTDTLYGIMCDALNPKAIEKICRLKGINPDKTNLSIICSDISMASEYSRINNKTFQLMKEMTPGAVTFLLRTASSLPRAFKGRKTVGVRIPDCTIARETAATLGHPLLTTSIEYADEDYARNPELIAEAYNDRVDLMVEGEEGDTEPSAIFDCTDDEPQMVREREPNGH